MCNRTIADVQRDAIQLADELIGNRNLEDFSSQEFQQISNRLVDFLNSEVRMIFPNNSGDDAGENARIERNISHQIVRHINSNNLNSDFEVVYDDGSFNFRIQNVK